MNHPHDLADPQSCSSWWGLFNATVDAVITWQIGPLSFAVLRRAREWQICHRTSDWPDDSPAGWAVGTADSLDCSTGELERHVLAQTDGLLLIEPALADRSVVIKSAVPILVPAGEQISFYVSTPMWVRGHIQGSNHPLLDVAAVRMSDTWFGPSTMEGELCYATTITGRLYLDDLPVRAHRAITPLRIKNNGAAPLKLEKLSLPVPFLSLFDSQEQGLWTEEMTLLHDERKDLAQVIIGAGPPELWSRAERVGAPRRTADRSILYRTFGALFGS